VVGEAVVSSRTRHLSCNVIGLRSYSTFPPDAFDGGGGEVPLMDAFLEHERKMGHTHFNVFQLCVMDCVHVPEREFFQW